MKEEVLTQVPCYEGQEIVIQKMNFGQKGELAEISTEITVVGGKENVVIHPGKSRIYTLIYGIKSAPFFSMADLKHKETVVKGLDPDAGDYIHSKIQELNIAKYSEELEKKSEPQLPEKQ